MQDKRSHWAAHVQAWQSGELSQAAYCQAQGLSLANFRYWRAKLRTDEATSKPSLRPTSMVPIQVVPPTSLPGVEVCLCNGLLVRLTGPVDATSLAAVVRALSAC